MAHFPGTLHTGRAATGILAVVLFMASLGSAQAPDAANPSIAQAQNLISEGKNAEARTILEKVVKDFAGKPEAEEAGKLIDRVKTIDVLVDHTHEVDIPVAWLPDVLAGAGYGVTRTHAYLPSLRTELAGYELIILWQESTCATYDDLEYAVLFEYVKQGGHLVLISTPGLWLSRNEGSSASAYPLLRLARRFGLKLKSELEAVTVGNGKVYHYQNSTLFTSARLSARNPGAHGEIVRFFEPLLPYPQLEKSSRNDVRDPEIVLTQGQVTFRYSQTLKSQGLWVKKALPKMLKFYADLFQKDVANPLHVSGVAGTREHFIPRNKFEISLLQPKDKLLHELGMELYQAWLRPEGAVIDLPLWMEAPWADMTTTDLLAKLGVGDRYAGYERHHRGVFLGADADKNRIDISIRPRDGDYSYQGKCEYIFRDLVQKHGPSLLRKWRETLFLYHRAGQLPARPDTPETIRLLSLAVGVDLFPYFRGLGTRVPALPIDFAEPERLREQFAEKEGKAGGE